MGYPYGDTYLETIQKHPKECEQIKTAYYAYVQKFINEHGLTDAVDLTIKQQFEILGEAFEYYSDTLSGITDGYHFMWDVLGKLLTPTDEHNNNDV